MDGRPPTFPGGRADRTACKFRTGIPAGRQTPQSADGNQNRQWTDGYKDMVQIGKSLADWRAAWAQVRERMRRELGDPVFEAWIGPLSLESFDRDELRIGAAKPFVRNWVANHYVGRIEKAFLAEGYNPASVSIVISAALAPSIG